MEEECLHLHADRWRPNNLIGTGYFSSVYTVQESQGNYVMKISRLTYEESYLPDIAPTKFEERISIQNILASFGYSIDVEDSWNYEDVYGVTIMRRLPESLKDYLFRISKRMYIEAIGQLYSLISNVHDLGYTHGDIKLSNIMVENGKLYLIDFDYARPKEVAEVGRDMAMLAKTTQTILEMYAQKLE